MRTISLAMALAASLVAAERAQWLHDLDRIRITSGTVGPGGDLYIAGYAQQDLVPVTAGSPVFLYGGGDSFVARISADGVRIVWATYLGDPGEDWIHALELLPSGDLVIAGRSLPSNPFAGGPRGFIARLDAESGRTAVAVRSEDAQWNAVAVGPDGTIHAAGGSGPAGTTGWVLAGFDRNLVRTYLHRILGRPTGYATALAVEAGRTLIVGGMTGALGVVSRVDPRDGSAIELGSFRQLQDHRALPIPYAVTVDTAGRVLVAVSPEQLAVIAPSSPAVEHRILPAMGPPERGWIQARLFARPGEPIILHAPTTDAIPLRTRCPNLNRNVTFVAMDTVSLRFLARDYYARILAAAPDGRMWVPSLRDDRIVDVVHGFEGRPPNLECVTQLISGDNRTVAPGSMVRLTGWRIGPDQHAVGNGLFPTWLGGVSVYFDGVPAPLSFVGGNQIDVIVPFETAGRGKASILIVKDGEAIPPLEMPVVAAMPVTLGLRNGDGSVNGSANPAASGSLVQMYVMAGGVPEPVPQTGTFGEGNTVLRDVSAALLVYGFTPRIGFSAPPVPIPMPVEYAGDAPGLIQGTQQVNVRLRDAPSGSHTLELSFPGERARTTIYIR